MRWKLLLPPLGAILLAALAFAFWPEVPPPPAQQPPPAPLTAIAAAPAQPPPARPLLHPAPTVAPTTVAPVEHAPPPIAPAPSPPRELGELDPEPDPEHLRALGLTEADLEPLDGGPLNKLDKDGIKSAVQDKLPEIRECYDAWLAQNPALAGKLKVEFRIAEIPGRERAKVMGVDIPDGGLGHVAMEGCVKNVFSGLRFEAPRGGELRVSYPLSFEPRKENAPAP